MKKLINWGKPVSLAIILSAVGALTTPVAAVSTRAISNATQEDVAGTTPVSVTVSQLAQATPSLCRRVNTRDGLIVREKADPNSRQVGAVAPNSQVTLIQGYQGIKGPDGRVWIEIASPLQGFVSNGFPNTQSNLVDCAGTVGTQPQNPPTSDASLCRQVDRRAAPQGLAIRADASTSSVYKGGVGAGERVTLIAGNRLIPDKNGARRNWVEIASPIPGFISADNLILCP